MAGGKRGDGILYVYLHRYAEAYIAYLNTGGDEIENYLTVGMAYVFGVEIAFVARIGVDFYLFTGARDKFQPLMYH